MRIVLSKDGRRLLGGLALLAVFALTGCGFEERAEGAELRLALGFGSAGSIIV